MGFFASLLGTDPDSRIRKARKFLDRSNFSEARLELLDLEHPEAQDLLQVALDGLVRLNLEEAFHRGIAHRGALGEITSTLLAAPRFGELTQVRRAHVTTSNAARPDHSGLV